jgi:hypothetical protein
VAHTCNLSYSGGSDQEDRSLKPARANSSRDSIAKKPFPQKMAGGVAQGEGPEFKPWYCKKKKIIPVSKMTIMSGFQNSTGMRTMLGIQFK